MLTGAVLEFAIGVSFGWFRQSTPQDVFWHACLGMYAGGMLMRWWGRTWIQNLREACEQKAAALAAAAAAAAAAKEAGNPNASHRS